MNFSDLNLSSSQTELLHQKGYDTPTLIQEKAIPPILKGSDFIGTAQTGTGKTAAFLLPLIEILSEKKRKQDESIQALILTPTRELAEQVLSFLKIYGRKSELRFSAAYGGVPIEKQIGALEKGLHILIATPGRLIDLYNRKAVKFKGIEVFVLDEADRMLHMGFREELDNILKALPVKRQNLFFSATFSQEVRELSNKILVDPVEVSIKPEETTAHTVEQWIYPVDKSRKSPLLIQLLRNNKWKQAIIFTKTKNEANRVARRLEEKKISVVAIHGNKSQSVRNRNLLMFKKGQVSVLVATDVASRGLDIERLPVVINYNLPHVPENYIHRIGRTGRAEESGLAISLVCAEEIKELTDIERLIQNFVPRKIIEGFEPVEELKPSPEIKVRKIKKPKKKKNRD